MKSIFALAIACLSVSSFAQTYKYDCKLMTDFSITQDIVLTKNKLTLLDKVYGGKILKVVFDNDGLKGGNGKMKDRISFVANYEETDGSFSEVYEYLLTPDMLTGGSTLRNGSQGGFMSFAGHGYSWETFICFKK